MKMAPTGLDNSTARLDAGSRRASLQAATQHQHRDLDEHVADLDLSTLAHYRMFLRASAAALIGIEALLERAGIEQLLPDWSERTRTEAILADLRQLKVAATPFELRRAPPSAAEMFGMAYVLEGSRLGSKVLLNRVHTASDINVRTATSYLGANDAHWWRSFLQTLENAPEANDGEATTAGAIYAFALFQRAFTMPGNGL